MARSPSAAPAETEVDPEVTERRESDVESSIAQPYNVFLWNDPVTLMEVVVRVLKKVFGYGPEKAESLMLTAHHEGKVIVWTGDRDRAVRYCLELGTNGLQSTVARA
jgi:ATP-dependent Clp protease adaptor protein ClpS